MKEMSLFSAFNPLSTNPTKWSNTLKQFVGKLSTNCLSVFDHFMKLALKGLRAHIFKVFILCYICILNVFLTGLLIMGFLL